MSKDQHRPRLGRHARIAVLAAAVLCAATAAVAAVPASDGARTARAAQGGGSVHDALLRGGQEIGGAQATMFLRLDGIPGESTDARHAGEIDLHAFRVGVEHGTTQAGGRGGGPGSGVGRARFSTVQLDKTYDRASPALLQAAADGRRIPRAVVTFRRPGAEQQDFLTYTFTDVVVDAYTHGGRQEPPLLETVALDYGKVEVAYRRQNPDGSLGEAVTGGWDLAGSRGP